MLYCLCIVYGVRSGSGVDFGVGVLGLGHDFARFDAFLFCSARQSLVNVPVW